MPPDPPLPSWPPEDCSQVRLWLNARSDGECSPAQEGWLSEHLSTCANCSQEWAELQRVRYAFQTARFREAGDFEREELLRALGPRYLERGAWALIVAGSAVVLVFVVVESLSAAQPLALTLGLVFLTLGLSLLFLRILLERLRLRRHDPYRDIQR